MSENKKKYYWLKLEKDFFKQKEIKKLRKIAGGDTYTVIYLKMQLLSLDTDGVLVFEGLENSIVEELALELDEDVENVNITWLYLEKCNIIEQINDEQFLLPKTVELIGSETAVAERVRRHREKQKMLQCNTEVTNSNTDIEKDIDINIYNKNIVQPVAYLEKTERQKIDEFFANVWSKYPQKRGKGQIKDACKKELYKHGEEIYRAIERYVKYVDEKRKTAFNLSYQNGSTFFNSGYIDFLDANYTEEPKTAIYVAPATKKENSFHNFEQKSKGYTPEQLEEIGRRNFNELLNKKGLMSL